VVPASDADTHRYRDDRGHRTAHHEAEAAPGRAQGLRFVGGYDREEADGSGRPLRHGSRASSDPGSEGPRSQKL